MKMSMLSLTSTMALLFVSGCSETLGEYAFANAGFELGTLADWEVISGNAFSNDAVEVVSGDNQTWNAIGDFFFYGFRSGLSATGILKSPVFELKGNGQIGFMMGAGRSTNDCYVVLCASATDEELVYMANYDFDFENPSDIMHRVILDGADYIDQSVYLKLVDSDSLTNGYNYLTLDDFIINYQGQADEVGMANDATRYIANHEGEVVTTYRHDYHLMPPVGWMNDPNGFSFYDGKIHQFYQHNPYSTSWDTMYWGHATSTDFIRWNNEPVALAPDKVYDRNGCFSGSAIEKDGKLYLLYTGVSEDGSQQQALAVTDDGTIFEKLNRNPIISSAQLPQGLSRFDFRDPKIYYKDGFYYAIIGSKLNGAGGQLLLYKSSSLVDDWSYVGVVYASSMTGGGIFECPDFFEISGQDILLSSPQYLKDDDQASYQNVHSVTYQVGNLDYENGAFSNAVSPSYMEELDKGFDFYAAQTMKTTDGRTIMTAWMNMWGRSSFPSAGHGWTGAMVLPRELTLVNNHIYQNPVRELEAYRQNEKQYQNILVTNEQTLSGVNGKTVELEFTLDISNVSASGKAGVSVFKGTTNHTDIYYDKQLGMVVFDRRANGIPLYGSDEDGQNNVRYASVSPVNGEIKLRIFLDKSSVEVFINDGYYTMSGTVFPSENDQEISFFADGGSATIKTLTKYDIIVEKD